MHHHPILRTGAVAALALAALAPAAAAAPRDDDGRRLSPAALLEQGPRGGLPIVPSRPLDQGDSRTTPDPLFPEIGNKGYDARHYALELAYDPPTKGLSGTTTMRATALRELPRFSLDLQYYEVSAVAVDGAPARFRREGTKLLVTPASKLARGRDFVVATTYAGQAQAVIDPDGSREGFVPTSDGAFVVNQPIGAQGWFPNNNVPTDKATFDIAVTVPANREVQATGRLVSNALTTDGRRRWHWRATDPTATYLTTASIGDFELDTFALDSGQPFYQALDVTYTEARKVTMRARQRRSLEIIDWVEQLTGRSFPWEASGGTVDRSDVGYALETQTKPSYAINSLNSNGPSLSTIAHEHAHEWFGNSVSPHTWMDIWLNEGFADWVALAWNHEANGTQSPAAFFDELYADREYDIWDVAPAALPDATYLFHPTVYDRGAMVVEAIRQILGDDRFRAMLGTWYDEHRTSTATTADLIALVKRVDARGRGDRWDEFFQQWLYTAYTDDVSAPTITPGTF